MAEFEIRPMPVESGRMSVLARHWPNRGTFRGSLTVLHGIQSHGAWYEQSCGRLADAGFEVWMPDRRGSGLNASDRGDAPSFRRLLDDVADTMHLAPSPRFLVGISWGGKLAVAIQRRHAGLCDGLVLITPGLCQRVGLPLKDRIRVAIARIVNPTKLFRIPLNEPALFTANPNYLRFIEDDPIRLKRATARLLVESARLGIYNRLSVGFVRCPVLLLLAEHDGIIDNDRTRRFVGQFRTNDLTVREYPDAHHTLEFEPNGPPFVDDLIAWLIRQTQK